MQKDLLSFIINKQEFALEVDVIEMVEEYRNSTEVPNSKHFIEGLINLRGRIVPIVDLTKILEMNVESDHNFEKILILKIDDEEIGVLVNVVNDVVNIDTENLENYGGNEKFASMSHGIIQIDNRLIVYLNVDKIFELKKEFST
ncbi:MAG: chemotaxis protein CheW [Thermotogota bacterium]